jgi:putative tricarboxylic transport membrane protein
MGMSEILWGSFFALLSALFFAQSFRFPEQTIALSPAVYPRFVTVCLFLLSSLLVGQGVRKRLSGSGARPAGPRVDRTYVVRFALLAAAAFLYTRLLPSAGYLVATPLFVAAAMLLFGERKWYRVVLVSILTTAVLYGVFRMVFRVPLPRFSWW